MEQRLYQRESKAGSMWVVTVDGALFAYVNGYADEVDELVAILNQAAARTHRKYKLEQERRELKKLSESPPVNRAPPVNRLPEPDLSAGKGNIERYGWDRT